MATSLQPQASFPVSPLAREIFDLTKKAGHEARIVGGAVRDWLMGWPPGDIDMAVAMPISQAAQLFTAAGLRVVETGLAHGTVTVCGHGDCIEVTQTRIDVENDGRHAVVAFSADWAADAARRDLTVNAIYLDAAGTVHDPCDGQRDLASGRVRFVGRARDRVGEDALRMLRYCRFFGRFSGGDKAALEPDSEAIAAITEQAYLAAGLSGERVADELRKTVSQPRGAGLSLGLMQMTGVAHEATGVQFAMGGFDCLREVAASWLVALAVIIPPGSAAQVAQRLRLSRKDQRALAGMDQVNMRPDDEQYVRLAGDDWQKAVWYLARQGHQPADFYAVMCCRRGHLVDPAHYHSIASWHPPKCPVSGTDLLSHGVDNGPLVGQMLEKIERRWVESGFTCPKAELLAMVF